MSISDPIKVVLRDFCHVEWYEVQELSALVRSGMARFDTSLLERQLNQLIEEKELPVDDINGLTGNEFQSSDEARLWLIKIREDVFDQGRI